MAASHGCDLRRRSACNCADHAADRVPDVVLIHDQQWADGVTRGLHHLHSVAHPLVPHILMREDDAAIELFEAHGDDEPPSQLFDLVVYELLFRHVHRRLRVGHEHVLRHPAALDPCYLLVARAVSFVAGNKFESYDVVRRSVQQLGLFLGGYRVERR